MKKNTSGYSILIALFIIGFLLVLTAGVFRLVLNELQDNRGRNDYLKAQYAAEAGIELALLKIKEYGYGVVDEVPLDINDRSLALTIHPLDKSKYRGSKEALVGFTIDTKTQSYTGILESGTHNIIPLFYVDAKGKQHDVSDITLSKDVIDPVWNIVGSQYGLSGEGEFNGNTMGNYKFMSANGLSFEKRSVKNFLQNSTSNYLILFNPDPNTNIIYTLIGENDSFFSRPIGEIYASGKVGSYKQNIKVTLDNTAFLNILKYSLFSK